jgi:hypothetical protein
MGRGVRGFKGYDTSVRGPQVMEQMQNCIPGEHGFWPSEKRSEKVRVSAHLGVWKRDPSGPTEILCCEEHPL